MQKCHLILALCLIAAEPALIAAAPGSDKSSDSLPPVVIAGLNAYQDKGPEDAVRAWIKGGPMDGSKDALSQANILRQIQDYYGVYRGYDVINTRVITPKIHILYIALNYENGPIFARFSLYQTMQGWTMTNFMLNTKEELVLPATLQ